MVRACLAGSCSCTNAFQTLGAAIANIKTTNLITDDYVAILFDLLVTLMVALNAFSNETMPLGLEFSCTKTKNQSFDGLLEPV